jgi:hypothetical protein
MAKKKLSKKEQPNVNPELKGFDIKVNSFGEIVTNYDIDKINEFLNKNVDDKKLRNRDEGEKDDLDDFEEEQNK